MRGENDNSSLYLAIYYGDFDQAQKALKKGDINDRNEQYQWFRADYSVGYQPLIFAIEKKRIDICMLLIIHGANLDISDLKTGKKPFQLARYVFGSFFSFDYVKYLLGYKDDKGKEELDKYEFLKFLIQKGRGIVKNGFSLLKTAIMHSDIKSVELLFESKIISINDLKNPEIFCLAAEFSDGATILHLLDKNADLFIGYDKKIPIDLILKRKAALKNSLEGILKKVDVKKEGYNKFNILHYCAYYLGHDEIKIVNYFIQNHPQLIVAKNELSETPLDVAMKKVHLNTVVAILECKADISNLNIIDSYIILLNYLAAFPGIKYLPTVFSIVLLKIDPSRRFHKGCTILHHAAVFLTKDFVKIIAHFKKESIDIKNDDGETPLQLAIENGNVSAVSELVKYGADIFSEYGNKFNAIDLIVNKVLYQYSQYRRNINLDFYEIPIDIIEIFDPVLYEAIWRAKDFSDNQFKSPFSDPESDEPIWQHFFDNEFMKKPLFFNLESDEAIRRAKQLTEKLPQEVSPKARVYQFPEQSLNIKLELFKTIMPHVPGGYKDKKHNNTILHYAASFFPDYGEVSFEEAIYLFLRKEGVDIDAQNDAKKTPLMIALENGNVKIAEIFRRHNAA